MAALGLSQLENFHCSHRRPAGLSFPGLYFSLNQHSIETLNFLNTHDSLESLNFHHSVLQSHHLVETPLSEAQPGRKRAPTPEELRRRLPHTFRRIITVHPRVTFGPTEPRDVIQARTRSDQYSQYRTLRGAETGQAAPVK
ncbi:hypothetical protein MTP99_004844 [Tenebrio molitor]|nr:hypothetical protein MTP99_004844 [Tenebrio molitor]